MGAGRVGYPEPTTGQQPREGRNEYPQVSGNMCSGSLIVVFQKHAGFRKLILLLSYKFRERLPLKGLLPNL